MTYWRLLCIIIIMFRKFDSVMLDYSPFLRSYLQMLSAFLDYIMHSFHCYPWVALCGRLNFYFDLLISHENLIEFQIVVYLFDF